MYQSNINLCTAKVSRIIKEQVLNDDKFNEIFEENEDFLKGRVSKKDYYVQQNLKVFFTNVKYILEKSFKKIGYDLPNLYFIVITYHNENGAEDNVNSLSVTIHSTIYDTKILERKITAYGDSFYVSFKSFVSKFVEQILDQIIAENNLRVINRALFLGYKLWQIKGEVLDSVELENLLKGTNTLGKVDVMPIYNELLNKHKIIVSYDISDQPIVDISKGSIVLGVTVDKLVNMQDENIVKIVEFLNQVQAYFIKVTEMQANTLKYRIEASQEEANQKTGGKQNVLKNFSGLSDVLETTSSINEEQVDKYINDNERKKSSMACDIIYSWMGIEKEIKETYNKIYSSQDTIELLNTYPDTIMDIVATNPSRIKTKRIVPLIKDSFNCNPEEFRDLDNGLIFQQQYDEDTGVLYGSIKRKVQGKYTSVGLDVFPLIALTRMLVRRRMKNDYDNSKQ